MMQGELFDETIERALRSMSESTGVGCINGDGGISLICEFAYGAMAIEERLRMLHKTNPKNRTVSDSPTPAHPPAACLAQLYNCLLHTPHGRRHSRNALLRFATARPRTRLTWKRSLTFKVFWNLCGRKTNAFIQLQLTLRSVIKQNRLSQKYQSLLPPFPSSFLSRFSSLSFPLCLSRILSPVGSSLGFKPPGRAIDSGVWIKP
jgi:hypothetical protein